MTLWDWLSFLWSEAYEFLNIPIKGMGIDFTLWQFALGSAILGLILYAVFRTLD